MALTITPEILGQQAESYATYCYLYEPLRVSISESDTSAQQIFVELEIIDTEDSTVIVENLLEYGVYDLNPGQPLSIDLMKLAQQHHDANVYNFSSIDDIVSYGWTSIVSKYKYNFKITSDITTAATSIIKLPIIGGRSFTDFVPAVPKTDPITEIDVQGINLSQMAPDWPYLATALGSATQQDSKPTVNKLTTTNIHRDNYYACGGQLIWKSRLGGYSTWAMGMKKEKTTRSYTGNIQVGMFNSTQVSGGNAFVPVDYTGIETSYTIDLKQLALTSNELRAVHGIMASPAVYYMKENTGELELMRVAGANAPLNNLANGGDFSVTLKSISNSSQNTR